MAFRILEISLAIICRLEGPVCTAQSGRLFFQVEDHCDEPSPSTYEGFRYIHLIVSKNNHRFVLQD